MLFMTYHITFFYIMEKEILESSIFSSIVSITVNIHYLFNSHVMARVFDMF